MVTIRSLNAKYGYGTFYQGSTKCLSVEKMQKAIYEYGFLCQVELEDYEVVGATELEDNELLAIWAVGNNNGDGFAVGEEIDTVSSALVTEGYKEVRSLNPEGTLLAEKEGKYVVVADLNGPWGVQV